MINIIERLTEVLSSRRQADPDSSYVAQLHNKGLYHILKKVGEESADVLNELDRRFGLSGIDEQASRR